MSLQPGASAVPPLPLRRRQRSLFLPHPLDDKQLAKGAYVERLVQVMYGIFAMRFANNTDGINKVVTFICVNFVERFVPVMNILAIQHISVEPYVLPMQYVFSFMFVDFTERFAPIAYVLPMLTSSIWRLSSWCRLAFPST